MWAFNGKVTSKKKKVHRPAKGFDFLGRPPPRRKRRHPPGAELVGKTKKNGKFSLDSGQDVICSLRTSRS